MLNGWLQAVFFFLTRGGRSGPEASLSNQSGWFGAASAYFPRLSGRLAVQSLPSLGLCSWRVSLEGDVCRHPLPLILDGSLSWASPREWARLAHLPQEARGQLLFWGPLCNPQVGKRPSAWPGRRRWVCDWLPTCRSGRESGS